MAEVKQMIHDWRFKSHDMGWMPARVPGCVHTDLLRNGKIAAPFAGMNEGDLQWIDKQDWEYQAEFDVSADLLRQDRVNLVFAGLDTYADVYLNDQKVISADNMFRTWQADVKHLLKESDNILRVYFHSPVNVDLPKLEKLGYALPATNDQSERGGLGDKKISVFARKAPYHYGWDWGPRFVTSGIWREVRLEGYSLCRVTDLYIQQNEVSAASAKLTAVLEVEASVDFEGQISIQSDGVLIEQQVSLGVGQHEVRVDFAVEHPKLWWSRGLGEQHLYEFVGEVTKAGELVASKRVKTGLRSLRLVQEDDERGTSFYFEVNGVPVFAKGANHIPNDSFLTEITYDRYQYEIMTASESNMNMLRVWGGGIYEEDDFYNLCDEYGILVWQDFMFACSMYPGDEAFLQNVKIEAEENIKRLRNHPSIALWCGNNEMDTAWSEYDENAGWGWKQQYAPAVRKKIWHDYEAIFHRILPDALSTLAPMADYWPSSPMRALTRDKDQHAKNDSAKGDIHYWGVWHAVEPFSNYNVYLGRFMSEYGFQSFPELKTVQTYAQEEDMALESDVMRWHQRSGDGNRLIKQYMDIYSKEPKDFPSFLYMSQVLQAEAIQSAMEAHRRQKPYCMGTLFWQINDCWPVASWSSMDYYGRWKALQYFAKNSYRDVMLSVDSATAASGTVDVHVVSDVLNPIEAKIEVKAFDFGGALLHEVSQAIVIGANTAQKVLTLTQADALQGRDASEVVLSAQLVQGDEVLDAKIHYLVSARDIRLQAPNIKMTAVDEGNGKAYILETDVLAKNVWLSSDFEGIFSDNYFDLIPGIKKRVTFMNYAPGQMEFVLADAGQVQVRSMADFVKVLG